MQKKKLYVNGIARTVVTEASDLLSDVIRKTLRLTGTKVGCGQGQCGACNVIIDGKLLRSCITKMDRVADGAAITTIEGIGTPSDLHALQMAWMVHGGAQCGFCTPGFIVSAKALIDTNPDPSREDIRDWFQKYRNACRCTGYKQLVESVQDAVKVLEGVITMKDLTTDPPGRQGLWHQYATPQCSCQGYRDLGLRCRQRSGSAGEYFTDGPRTG